jgi:hypothetical protein
MGAALLSEEKNTATFAHVLFYKKQGTGYTL